MPLERMVVVGYLNLGTPQNAFKILNGIITQVWGILEEYPFSVNMIKSFMLMLDALSGPLCVLLPHRCGPIILIIPPQTG